MPIISVNAAWVRMSTKEIGMYTEEMVHLS